MKKVVRDGKVAVLYSPGFGSGWYSWNTGFKECLFYPEIVALVESRTDKNHDEITDKINELAESLWEGFYSGGAGNLEIEWVDEGTHFLIDEYDGSERINYIDEHYLVA